MINRMLIKAPCSNPLAHSVLAYHGGSWVSMLRITTESKRAKTVLTIEGRMAGPSVATVEQCWRELHTASPKQRFIVNLCGVGFIDNAGKALLREMHRLGAELQAEGCLNESIVEEISTSGETSAGHGGKHAKKSKGAPIIFYVAFLSFLLLPALARAQEKPAALPGNAPADTLRLTLEQAVSLAIKQNPTQQIAVLSAAERVQDKNITRADLLPQANLKVSDSANRLNLQSEFGGKPLVTGVEFPGHIGPFQLFSAGPSFGSSIFDFSLWKKYQAARGTVNAAKADSLSTREQVILLVVSQYIGTLRAVANVEASRSRVELAQALYDQAADLQKEGVGTGIDTLRANVELQNEKQTLLQAQDDRETSLYGLSRLLNLDPRQSVELGDSLSFFDTPQPDVFASIDSALGERQEWKSLQEQIKSAGLEKKASQESRLPKLDFNGNWAYEGASSTSGIPTYNYAANVT